MAVTEFVRAHARGIIATTIAIVLALAGTAGLISLGMDLKQNQNPSPAPPTGVPLPTVTTAVAPKILSQDTSKTIRDVEGIDLDTGDIKNQDILGVDASPSRTADRLNAMTNAASRFAIPGQGADSVFHRCSTVPEASWTHPLLNLYALDPGATICVRTDQGNISAMTVTHVPSAGEPHLEFDYITWRAR